MAENTVNRTDEYIHRLFIPDDPALQAIPEHAKAEGLPPIGVPPTLGRLLGILIRATGARRVVEIGTLGGYSATWMARALPADGKIISLELDPHHAEVARANLAQAGVGAKVEIRVGRALDLLPALVAEGPFDFAFIDADKGGYPDYLAWAREHVRVGGVIVADNVLRGGRVLDANAADGDSSAMDRFNHAAASDPRLDAIIVPNRDGRDGVLIATVIA